MCVTKDLDFQGLQIAFLCYEVCVIMNKHPKTFYLIKMKMSSRRRSHFEVAFSFWDLTYIYIFLNF
jgi:hypothetical protein